MAATGDRHRFHPTPVSPIRFSIRRSGAEDRPRTILFRPRVQGLSFDVKPASATDVDEDEGKGFAMYGIRSFYECLDFKDFGLTDKEEYSYAMRAIDEASSITVPEIISTYEGFDFKDCGLTDKEEYSCAMRSLDETNYITVPEIISMGMDYGPNSKNFIWIEAKEHHMDGSFLSMGMDYGPESKNFLWIEAKEHHMDGRFVNKTRPKLVLSIHVGFDFKYFGLTDKEEYPNAMCFLDKTVPEIISMGMGYGPNSKDVILIEAKECCMDQRFLNKTSFKLVSEFVRIRPNGNDHCHEPMLALGILSEGPSTPVAESSSADTLVNNVLLLDSAAGHHMVSHPALLSNLRDPPSGMDRVRTADGLLLPVVGYGDIRMEDFDIPDVCLVRGLEVNVISVGQLASSHNICSCFFGNQCNLMLSNGLLIGGALRRNDNQYVLRFLEIP